MDFFQADVMMLVFEDVKYAEMAKEKIRQSVMWDNGQKIEFGRSVPSNILIGRNVPYELMIPHVLIYEDELSTIENELRRRFPRLSEIKNEKWCRRIFIRFNNFPDIKRAFQLGKEWKIQDCTVTLLNVRKIDQDQTRRYSKRYVLAITMTILNMI